MGRIGKNLIQIIYFLFKIYRITAYSLSSKYIYYCLPFKNIISITFCFFSLTCILTELYFSIRYKWEIKQNQSLRLNSSAWHSVSWPSLTFVVWAGGAPYLARCYRCLPQCSFSGSGLPCPVYSNATIYRQCWRLESLKHSLNSTMYSRISIFIWSEVCFSFFFCCFVSLFLSLGSHVSWLLYFSSFSLIFDFLCQTLSLSSS